MTVHEAAVVDTNIIAALRLYDPSELPETILITAVTLGELSFGPHATDDPVKRAGRVAVLQHAEATFDPLPYDQGAARLFGQICAAVRAAGREPRKRASDLMIAATASIQIPLYTANPDDFKGAEGLVEQSLRAGRQESNRMTSLEGVRRMAVSAAELGGSPLRTDRG